MLARPFFEGAVRRSLLSILLLFAFGDGLRAQAPGWSLAADTRAPNRFVGKVYSFRRDGSVAAGSGVLVGPRHFVSAGHVLSDSRAIVFTPGMRGQRAPFGSANVVQYAVSRYFEDGSDTTRDFGIARLNRPLGSNGFAQMGEWPNYWQYDVRVVGYPGGSYGARVKNRMHVKRTLMSNASNKPNASWHRVWSPFNTWGMAGVSGGALFDAGILRGIYTGRKGLILAQRMHGFRFSHIPLGEIRSWIRRYP